MKGLNITHLRQDAVNDYFEVIIDDEITEKIYPFYMDRYRLYPRTMDLRVADVTEDVEIELRDLLEHGGGNGLNKAASMMSIN